MNDNQQNIYFYQTCGLQLLSEMMLPELQVSNGQFRIDVRIGYGKVPVDLPEAAVKTEHYQVATDQFLLKVNGVGRYYVTGGAIIVIEPAAQASDQAVRFFLLGQVLGLLLLQRGVIPIHGGGVAMNGQGVVFTGLPGAGKSTLTAACHRRGYGILADDVAPVTFDQEGRSWIEPAYPQQRLCRDSAEALKLDIGYLRQMLTIEPKYAVPVAERFQSDAVPLAVICEVVPVEAAEVQLVPVSGKEKVTLLLENTYCAGYLQGIGLKTEQFKRYAILAEQAAVVRLIRPKGRFTLPEQIAAVERHLAEIV